MRPTSLFCFLVLISASTAALVKWIPNTSFNLPSNFKDRKLPCSKQTVVFPQVLNTAVKIETETFINGLVLPTDGEIIISDGALVFGGNDEANCSYEDAYYVPRSVSSWMQPDVWDSDKFNEATPDSVRIPCFDDDVEFPTESQFTVQLPNVTQVVRSVKLGGRFWATKALKILPLIRLFETFTLILNENMDTGVSIEFKQCDSRQICMCQEHQDKMDCSVKFCPKPKCVDPIQPIGHCCKICGGYVTINVDENFDIQKLRMITNSVIDEYGKDRLVYHIGRFPGDIVQVVVVEKGEYTGLSAQAANEIKYETSNQNLQSVGYFSGSPLSISGLGGKIAVSVFFVVAAVMGSIYAYYYKLPDVRFPLRGNHFGGVLSRFSRRSDSVVSLTRRDSTATVRSGFGTAFRNPLYDSKRGRVQVMESAVEE